MENLNELFKRIDIIECNCVKPFLSESLYLDKEKWVYKYVFSIRGVLKTLRF